MNGRAERKQVRLKNGTEIDARTGLAELEQLKYWYDRDPAYFNALVALAQGRRDDVLPAHLDFLREAHYLGEGDDLNPTTRDVVLSAYRQSPEGPVLVCPFSLRDRDEALELENLLDEKELRDLRKRLGNDRDPGPDRGRG